MKSLVSWWESLANEAGDLCGISASRDIRTMSRRCEKEGDAFLRITLPTFGKAFDRAISNGRWDPTLCTSFKHRGGLPVFLRGFLDLIFTPDGVLRAMPCTEAIRSVRQLAAVYGKIEGACSPQRDIAAIAEYCRADDECLDWDLGPHGDLLDELREVANRVVVPFLAEADFKISNDEIVPSHGSGSTADRLMGNLKYDLEYWPAHLESRFPWIDWAVPNHRYGDHWVEDEWGINPTHSPGNDTSTPVVPAKLTLVPKTMSSPRVIVMEPTSLQYMQQGLWRCMRDSIERSTTLVGFIRQDLNRDMARRGSIDGSLVTLDLSEASDRVTYLQAASVIGVLPNIWEALDATRSTEVKLPDGTIRHINKFASMGSAVCFPVEAVVFMTAIMAAIRRHHRKADPAYDLKYSFLRKLEGYVRVYGDDCIFPVEYLPEVEEVFQSLGWKINTNKTFSKGNFRESCGGDYWCGEDVTPVRARRPLPSSLRQAAEVQSLVSFRNQLYMAGYWKTTGVVDRALDVVLKGTFPIVKDTSAALGRTSVSFEPIGLGTDRYQRSLTKAYWVKELIPKNESSDRGKLLKCLIAPGKRDDHLLQSGRPSAVSIKRKWMPTH